MVWTSENGRCTLAMPRDVLMPMLLRGDTVLPTAHDEDQGNCQWLRLI